MTEEEKLNKATENLMKDVAKAIPELGFCPEHPETRLTMELDKINNIESEACVECIKKDDIEDEEQRTRLRFKKEVTFNVAEKLYAIMDEEISPYMNVLAYTDLVDIMVGIMHSNCIMQLEQTASMGQEDAFMYLKQRWYLTTMEFLKAMSKQKYNGKDVKADPELAAKIESFEKEEREQNVKAGVACSTEGCIHKVEEGLTQCLSCMSPEK